MSIMNGKWTVLKCECGCEFAYRKDTYKDDVGYEACPDCGEAEKTTFLGWKLFVK